METFNASWTCANCNEVTTYTLSKREAAFFDTLKPEKSISCASCGGFISNGGGHPIPNIDNELLSEWATDPNLSFLSQDQDLILADAKAIWLAEHYLSVDTAEEQRGWLLAALMVKLHDDKFLDAAERNWTINFLKNHQADWTNYYIEPYVKKKVTGIIEG